MSQEALCECGQQAGTNTDECSVCRFIVTEVCLQEDIQRHRQTIRLLLSRVENWDLLALMSQDEVRRLVSAIPDSQVDYVVSKCLEIIHGGDDSQTAAPGPEEG